MTNKLKKIWKWLGEYHGDQMPVMMTQILDHGDNEIYIYNIYQEQIRDGRCYITHKGKELSFPIEGKQRP